ncbi:MAG: phenylphosphate carboxylase subunit delta [Nitrospinota bacterium]|nr:MAG: phenylphosphate carboxylase subunit delta [Nitrospinota bacterium]
MVQPYEIALQKAQKVKLLILDVDGVMTDGRVTFDAQGQEMKTFHVRDGHGIVLAHQANLRSAILSGRASDVVAQRAAELGIDLVFQKVYNKLEVYETLLAQTGLQREETAYIGDDVVDIPVLRQVGFSVAVADAVPEVKEIVDFVTEHKGGEGAVRECIELILRAQGVWSQLIAQYST